MTAPLPGQKKPEIPSITRLKVSTEDEKNNAARVLNEIAWYICDLDSDSDSDGHILASLLTNISDLDKIADHFDGAIIKTQPKKERRDSRMLATAFYLYEIQKKSWGEIRVILRDNASFRNFNLISLRKRVNKIRKALETNKKQMWEKVHKLNLESVLAAIYEQKI